MFYESETQLVVFFQSETRSVFVLVHLWAVPENPFYCYIDLREKSL